MKHDAEAKNWYDSTGGRPAICKKKKDAVPEYRGKGMKHEGTMKITITVVFAFSLLFLFAGIAASDDGPFKGPWEKHTDRRSPQIQSSALNPLKYIVRFYRDYISPIDGDRCPMYPTCSQYSIECFEKHGLIIGWLMTWDRLFHEADEMKRAPLVWVHDYYRFYDPLENNDFWWYKK